MQYIEHDFFNNFKSAYNSKDLIFVKDVLVDEIAKLSVHDRVRLIKTLNESKVYTDSNISNTALGKLVSANIAKNEKLRKGIISLIVDNNGGAKEGLRLANGIKQDNSKETLSSCLDKALVMSFKGSSFTVLNSRIAQHLTQRKYMGRLSFDGDDATVVKAKDTAKIVALSILGTSIVLVSAYFLIKYFKNTKTSSGLEPEVATATVDIASMDSVPEPPIVQPQSQTWGNP